MTASPLTPKPAAQPLSSHPAAGALTDLLTIDQLSTAQLRSLLTLAARVKASGGPRGTPGPDFAGALAGTSVTMLFEKPSLRTRMSFEIGLAKLGAQVIYFDHSKQKIGQRESVKDYAKNLERWTDAVIARVFSHGVLEQMAEHAAIPVVNALSDLEHPCQALADFQTLAERLGGLDALRGARLGWVGDGNNVCHSLMLGAAKLGMSFTAVTPPGFEPKFAVVRRALEAAHETGATITLSHRLKDIAAHDVVYTDTWVSMGQEHQGGLRNEAFLGFQVDAEVMDHASHGLAGGRRSAFMHCLPAHRGEEVTDEVIDAPDSLVYDQAENRLWAQQALFIDLFRK
jgi:ornithine carbamoyltransferase